MFNSYADFHILNLRGGSLERLKGKRAGKRAYLYYVALLIALTRICFVQGRLFNTMNARFGGGGVAIFFWEWQRLLVDGCLQKILGNTTKNLDITTKMI